MIVVDASVVVEVITNGALSESLRDALGNPQQLAIAPYVIDLEVLSAIRRMLAGRRLDSHQSSRILSQIESFPVERLAHTPLLRRIWELRHNFTAYDAAYVALAEETGAVLYTCDSKLATGHRARVKVFIRS